MSMKTYVQYHNVIYYFVENMGGGKREKEREVKDILLLALMGSVLFVWYFVYKCGTTTLLLNLSMFQANLFNVAISYYNL